MPSATVPAAIAVSPPPASCATPAPATPRPTDAADDARAADLAAHIELATGEVGPTAVATVERGAFILVAERPGPFFDASVKLAHDALEAYYNGRFAALPPIPVTLYLFTGKAPYEAFCTKRFGRGPTAAGCTGVWGFYHPESHELFANLGPGATTLTHEMVHAIVAADFPRIPRWFNEGLASLFEHPKFPRPGEIHGATNWRRTELLPALTAKTARLDELFGMPDDTFKGVHVDRNYAVARYACQWLDEKGWLWPFYHAWRDGFAADPTGQKAFVDTVGKTPSAAQADWVTWARGQ